MLRTNVIQFLLTHIASGIIDISLLYEAPGLATSV